MTQSPYAEIITDDEVIAAGLIASSISINEGVSQAIQEHNNLDDDILLIKLAVFKLFIIFFLVSFVFNCLL